MLAAITKHEEKFKPLDDSILATHALPHSIRHQYLIDAVTQDFLTALHNVPNGKWRDSLQPVPHKLTGRKKMAPKLLVDLGGEKYQRRYKSQTKL